MKNVHLNAFLNLCGSFMSFHFWFLACFFFVIIPRDKKLPRFFGAVTKAMIILCKS